MTFDQWLKRPVYVAQCKTWQIAAETNLCGFLIRTLPGHRTRTVQLARDLLALHVRYRRFMARNFPPVRS